MLPSFATKTITRRRYPSTSDSGTTVTNYQGTPTDTPIVGCWYEPINSTEEHDGRHAVRTGYTVAAPPGIDLTENDHVVIEGIEFEVDGRPLPVPSPTGALDSTKFTTRLWEG